MKPEFDVLFIYNSEDRASAVRIATQLVRRGIRVWVDVWEIPPGVPWQKTLEQTIKRCRAAAVLVGSSGLGPWQRMEIEAILHQFIKLGKPIIPVLLPDAPSRISLPIFLRGLSWVDFRRSGLLKSIDSLVWGITGKRPKKRDVTSAGAATEGVKSAQLEQVFCTSGLPKYTYVEPAIYERVARDIRQSGKHVAIVGPSGSGKTCLVFRMMRELQMEEGRDFRYISALGLNAREEVNSALSTALAGKGVRLVIVDDFHSLDLELRSTLGSRLKQLADLSFLKDSATTFLLLGISPSAEQLLFNTTDLGLRIGVYRMPIATAADLKRLLRRGERRLSVEFPGIDSITSESAGSYYICQYLAQEICLENGIRATADSLKVLDFRIEEIRNHLLEELGARFRPALEAFVKHCGASDHERLPSLAIIAALTAIAKPSVSLQEVTMVAAEFGQSIQEIKSKVPGLVSDLKNHEQLGRYIYYEPDSERFWIDDPIFRYFLSPRQFNMLLDGLGLDSRRKVKLQGVVESGRNYSGISALQSQPTSVRKHIFISYSHLDQKWLEEIQRHLTPLFRGREALVWADTRIEPGQHWRDEIKAAISRAKVALLLVSPNYLASDFISEHELAPILRASSDDGLTILWVPLSASLYSATDIGTFQAACDPSRPLDSLTRARRNRLLVEIAHHVEVAVEG